MKTTIEKFFSSTSFKFIVIGTLSLILATIMMISRNINWYRQDFQNK
jgi:hypothetical protein